MKTEEVLSCRPKALSQAQREYYFENGYLLLENFITGDLLKRLQDVTEEFIQKSKEYHNDNPIKNEKIKATELIIVISLGDCIQSLIRRGIKIKKDSKVYDFTYRNDNKN